MRRSRTTRSYARQGGVPLAAELSYTAVEAQTATRRSNPNNVWNHPAPPPPLPQPRQALQVKFIRGGGFSIVPAWYVDVCNYCRRVIGRNEFRYMNGPGFKAYCSSGCRDEFNNINNTVEVAEECSVESYPSMEEEDGDEELND